MLIYTRYLMRSAYNDFKNQIELTEDQVFDFIGWRSNLSQPLFKDNPLRKIGALAKTQLGPNLFLHGVALVFAGGWERLSRLHQAMKEAWDSLEHYKEPLRELNALAQKQLEHKLVTFHEWVKPWDKLKSFNDKHIEEQKFKKYLSYFTKTEQIEECRKLNANELSITFRTVYMENADPKTHPVRFVKSLMNVLNQQGLDYQCELSSNWKSWELIISSKPIKKIQLYLKEMGVQFTPSSSSPLEQNSLFSQKSRSDGDEGKTFSMNYNA